MTSPAATDVVARLRRILADLTGDDDVLSVPARTPLLRDGVGLDSLGGSMLLTQVRRQFGVDVAGEDLNLDSLATLGTLADFIVTRLRGAPRRRDDDAPGPPPHRPAGK